MKLSFMPLLVTAYIKLQKQFEMIRNSKAYVEMLRTREQMLRGKVKIAFELLEQDVLDPEAYRQSVCNCMGKIKEIEQEVLKIENLRSVDQDIRDQLRKSENCVDDILSGNRTVSNGEYRELLSTCIDHISVYRERVHVVSSIGDFSLPRVPRDHRQLKLMPQSRLERHSCDGQTNFYVIFFSQPTKDRFLEQRILAEWENLKIILEE